MCPTTLAQLQEYVDHHREQFYLDGPNDVDWIFRNEVIEGRESTLYVDYVAHDDEHRWSDPTDLEDLEFGKPLEPGSVVTARRLNDIGISSPETLATIAEVWRIRPPVPDTQWSEIRRANHGTLELMESRSRLKEQPSSTYSWLMEQWQFPMYDLDLSEIPVSLAGLRERQKKLGSGVLLASYPCIDIPGPRLSKEGCVQVNCLISAVTRASLDVSCSLIACKTLR